MATDTLSSTASSNIRSDSRRDVREDVEEGYVEDDDNYAVLEPSKKSDLDDTSLWEVSFCYTVSIFLFRYIMISLLPEPLTSVASIIIFSSVI